MASRCRRVLSVAVTIVVVGAVACSDALPPRRQGGDARLGTLPLGVSPNVLNVLVVSLDTTRADHLGAYGYAAARTPVFDRLAQDGVLFEQVTTPAPLTVPAHASLFTGRFPFAHGVRDNGGYFLGPEQVTLAERLHEAGFQTGAFVGAYVLDAKWGLNQGFDTYFDDFDLTRARGPSVGNLQRRANEVVDHALGWLDTVGTARFFAWVHLYDAHAPYDPPEPFKTAFRADPYDGEIAFADQQLGRLIGHLESRGLLDRTIIVVAGDHGEGLGAHGETGHGFFIYESVTRVPLVVRAPFGATRHRRVREPVRLIDVVPTVLELLGLPAPRQVDGTSLVALLAGVRREPLDLEGYTEAMYPLHHYGWSELKALRLGRYKIIDAPRPELFDLERDPGETTNLFDERRTLGERMRARLKELQGRPGAASVADNASKLDPDARARLAALGYVGSFVASAGDGAQVRADPKDRIALFNLMADARDAMQDPSGFPAAADALRRVIASDPGVVDAWFSLGNLYFQHQRYRESLSYFQKALALKPDYDLAVMNMAAAYRNLGQDAAAVAGFERYLRTDPHDAYAHYHLGEIYLDRGDLVRADAEFRRALELDAQVAPAKNARGVIAFRQGDLDSAERWIREALALRADVRLAHYNLALIAEERHDDRLAEREYLLELEQHPDAYRAATNLAQVYRRRGDFRAERDALEQAVEGNPRFAEGFILLARASLDAKLGVETVIESAQRGLRLDPRSPLATLAHGVLATAFERKGMSVEANAEARLAHNGLQGRGR